MTKKKILIVEDEKHIAEGLRFNLARKGYELKVTYDGITALDEWKIFEPDLIILDLMLPEMDGFKVLEHIRLDDDRLPVLILSARDAVEDKVRCLKKGVDDYLSKPFDLDELLLRVEGILKRAEWAKKDDKPKVILPEKYEFGDFWVNFKSHRAKTLEDGEIDLTIQELKLLKVFFLNKDKVLSRKFLLENAFGYSIDVSSRTVDNFIVRFRKYFEDNPKNPTHFVSKRAMGYIFNQES